MSIHAFNAPSMRTYQQETEAALNGDIAAMEAQKQALQMRIYQVEAEKAAALAARGEDDPPVDVARYDNEMFTMQNDIAMLDRDIADMQMAIEETNRLIQGGHIDRHDEKGFVRFHLSNGTCIRGVYHDANYANT